MKVVIKIIFFILVVLSISSGHAQTDSSIVFNEERHDFGDLIEGDTVLHVFTFKNNTANSIQIIDVVTQCGCTFGESDMEEFIEPGKSGKLKIYFNSSDKEGFERKTIRVKFSDFTTKKLVILANVIITSN